MLQNIKKIENKTSSHFVDKKICVNLWTHRGISFKTKVSNKFQKTQQCVFIYSVVPHGTSIIIPVIFASIPSYAIHTCLGTAVPHGTFAITTVIPSSYHSRTKFVSRSKWGSQRTTDNSQQTLDLKKQNLCSWQ